MSAEIPSPRDLAERAIADARLSGGATSSAAAASIAFERTSGELLRWLGAGGCHALLSRALTQARDPHPALSDLVLIEGPPPRLDGVTDAVASHGPKKVGAGVEAALVALFELLSRLVGADLTARLAESSMSNDGADGTTSKDRESAQ